MTSDGEPRPKDGAACFLQVFENPLMAVHYHDGPRQFVPGLEALHRMTGILLAERVPSDARILVLGAGGGLELRALAESFGGWRFVGVDPAAQMLKLAEATLGGDAARVDFVQGYIDDAPQGPFDAAVCLLTLHFLDEAERLRTAREICRRLKPDAPFVAAHGSFPQEGPEKALWLSRYAAYAIASGADPEQVAKARDAVDAMGMMLSPQRDEAVLRQAGFSDVSLFYAAFTWRGWVGYA
ncbi:tRNA (cmo5U34)-methyltransferase [Rhizomicrobium palustre]|uniref:tRNA (Cmo5U34)-methyltransferase n=1 Tax=Rhizomicrobium palustre TaxID=189966 RepID=A0A846N2B7_9PROT|nr:class I SAM-dependent methyltransferase [Rhizomicrobium palustre]NIK89753.1 tRNA (cmo5U34)-methyltransferase [Rhizomicrobium palustre]